jgi:enoyl-CoA hydratase/carnithine racemase
LVERLDDPAIVTGVRDTGGRVTLAIYACTKPVIAAINGAAVGIGATMTLAMDIRMVAETAKIGFVFGRLGIVPEACSSYFLPRIVGLQQALEWTLSADMIGAEEAKETRLVRSVHPADRLLDDAKALARKFIDGRSPIAVALTRQLMVRGLGLSQPLEAHRADSLAMFYTSIGDGKEGVAAFLEKRAPTFTGRASDLPEVFSE